MSIKIMFFDMGGTIGPHYKDPEGKEKGLIEIRNILKKHNIEFDLTKEGFSTLISDGLTAYRKHRTLENIELTPEIIWPKFILKNYDVKDKFTLELAEELSLIISSKFFKRIMRPEMPEVLKQIKELGLKIGIISNIHSRWEVPYDLKEFGILEYFDPMILSSEVGFRKPRPEIFKIAAQKAGFKLEECAYVGDRMDYDVKGSKDAGFGLSVFIEFEKSSCPEVEGFTPDYKISNMLELVEILRTKK